MVFSKGKAEVAQKIYECINRKDIDCAISYVDENCEWLDVATGGSFIGPEGLRQFFQGWLGGLPDVQVEVRNLAEAEGSCVIGEIIVRGTHNGVLSTPKGQIRPTGRRLEFRACDVMQIEAGRLVSNHSYYDVATIMEQLGAMPETKAA